MIDLDAVGHTHGLGPANRSDLWLFAEGVPPAQDAAGRRALIMAGGENDTPPRALARAIRTATLRYVPAVNVRIIYRAAGL